MNRNQITYQFIGTPNYLNIKTLTFYRIPINQSINESLPIPVDSNNAYRIPSDFRKHKAAYSTSMVVRNRETTPWSKTYAYHTEK